MTEAEWLASADPAVLQMLNLPFRIDDMVGLYAASFHSIHLATHRLPR